ncbi:hypothetical protein F4703DRAFT_1799786 [Phycomyces blakesleeanus]
MRVNTLPLSFLQINTKRALSESFSEESVNKRNRVEELVKHLKKCFFITIRDGVEELVGDAKTQDKTNELKNKLVNVKTLPAAIITNTAQLANLFRTDLPPIVKTFVCTRLQDTMVTSTDYTLCFSALVNMMISELRSSEFFFDNNDIKIKKVPGFNLAELLPFVTTNEPRHTIQQLDKNLISSKRFDTEFKCLFTSQHLQIVHSYFF